MTERVLCDQLPTPDGLCIMTGVLHCVGGDRGSASSGGDERGLQGP